MDKIENKNLKDYIYEEILELIKQNKLIPEKRVNKNELASKFNVSLTPINDALTKLVGENYLVQVPRKGFFLKTRDLREISELYELRAGIEGIAIFLCLEKIEDYQREELIHHFDNFNNGINKDMIPMYLKKEKEFHEKIINYSQNDLFIKLKDTFNFFNNPLFNDLKNYLNEDLNEHLEIIKAIKAQNAEDAKKLMEKHFLNSQNRLLFHIS